MIVGCSFNKLKVLFAIFRVFWWFRVEADEWGLVFGTRSRQRQSIFAC